MSIIERDLRWPPWSVVTPENNKKHGYISFTKFYIYIYIENSIYIYMEWNMFFLNDYKPRILSGMIYLALFKVIWFLSKNWESIEGLWLLDSVLFFEVPEANLRLGFGTSIWNIHFKICWHLRYGSHYDLCWHLRYIRGNCGWIHPKYA
jgi:hypothetical protein